MEFQDLSVIVKKLLNVLNSPIFEINESKISITSIFFAAIVLLVSVRLSKFLGMTVKRTLNKKSVDSGVRDSLERFTRYIVIGLGLLLALDMLGFSLNSLAAVGAVLMVGIGFGLQNLAQNFISGLILLIERPVKKGDIVYVAGHRGRVLDIHVRSTVIKTRDGVAVIVPNSKFVSEEVVNDSFLGTHIRQHVKVGVAYGSDVELVKKILEEIADEHPFVLAHPKPAVIFEDFGDSSLDFDLRFWCSDPWEIDLVCSDIRYKVDQAFRANKVEIPFPQRDLNFKTSLSIKN